MIDIIVHGYKDIYAVLPSRSALSDLGLIAYLLKKKLLNWSSFFKGTFGKCPKESSFFLDDFPMEVVTTSSVYFWNPSLWS